MKTSALYVVVIVVAGFAGYTVNNALSAPESAPVIATSIASQASAAAATAVSESTSSEPTIKMPSLDGSDLGVDDFAGNIRLINFWATWCAPCRREIPLLMSIQATQPIEDLTVIGVAFDEADAVTAYHDDIQFNYPVMIGEDAAIALAEHYELELMALPFTLIVNRDGSLLNAHVGEVEDEEAAQIVDILRRLDAGEINAEQAKQELTL